MRTIWVLAVAVCVTAVPVRADDQDAARAIVERAIQAHGGEDALNHARMLSRTGEGNMYLTGVTPFTEETTFSLPDRIRITVQVNKADQLTLVINGDKAWQLANASVHELAKERMEEIREEAHVLWMATLTPLLKEPYKLSLLPAASVAGAPAEGVKVTAKGHVDAKLFFDKNTHLLVKIERRAREAGIPFTKAYFYSDYKDVDGVKLPLREVVEMEGKKITERSSAKYKILSQVDDALFAKP